MSKYMGWSIAILTIAVLLILWRVNAKKDTKMSVNFPDKTTSVSVT